MSEKEVRMELSHWSIISFEHNGKHVGRVLFGHPVNDPEHSWNTSLIVSVDGEYVTTQNSVYRVVGEGSEVTLPLSDIEYIRAGMSPEACEEMRGLEGEGFKFKGGIF
ncbi:hypothetical protein MSNKSG1_00733 [Marinobacter santoriniensis NKSG1]|uniref:Uncharacterized protein n=1 Tax=Marinobacter santoriniensis NKSG1 TaxID=1288826 RepID=M7D8Q1_9GAMM|nr:hypothetical protein [Marinobacter santoriniensis]EMP57103.1 hypothetical protein MSNKSG1_00733 [Marinobacter santoriniensis NKSG1]